MGKYCTADAVKRRLEGKVKFDDTGCDENRMSLALLNTLILEGETQLELDLMDRYHIPFQKYDCTPFNNLPIQTLTILRTLAELISVVRVLETDFGRGTSVNGDKYTTSLQKRYDEIVKKLVAIEEQTEKTSRQWKTRPLDGLQVAYNNEGDNGFRGRVHHTTTVHPHASTFATDQINSPGENWFTGIFEGEWNGR